LVSTVLQNTYYSPHYHCSARIGVGKRRNYMRSEAVSLQGSCVSSLEAVVWMVLSAVTGLLGNSEWWRYRNHRTTFILL